MNSTERNPTDRPGEGLLIVLMIVAVIAAIAASGAGDLIKSPMLRHIASAIAAVAAIAAFFSARSAYQHWARLLDDAEARPAVAAAPVTRVAAPAAPVSATNQRELEAEIERLRNVERDLTSSKIEAEAAMMAKGE